MKLIRLLATAMAGAATLLRPDGQLGRGQMAGSAPGGRGVTAPNHPAVGTAPAELSANRGAAAGQIGTGPPRSDEQIYYSI